MASNLPSLRTSYSKNLETIQSRFCIVAEHRKAKGAEAKALKTAHEEVEEQEDEHLYYTAGWTRELWIESLGMPAVLPPPEEVKKVETAIGAARAKHARTDML